MRGKDYSFTSLYVAWSMFIKQSYSRLEYSARNFRLDPNHEQDSSTFLGLIKSFSTLLLDAISQVEYLIAPSSSCFCSSSVVVDLKVAFSVST